jgi:hypothetical protein
MSGQIRRREFITLLAAWRLRGRSRPARSRRGKIVTIGILAIEALPPL